MPYKNIEKRKKRQKEYYEKNKEKIREKRKKYFKKYQEDNRESIKNYKQNWRKNNVKYLKDESKKYREKNKKYLKQYHREAQREYRKNPKFRLNQGISSRISDCLKGKKAGRTWETLVGYALQDLIQHLEKQFDENMNWQNYGSYWHIDHIVPVSWFPYQTAEERAFKDCWGLANLQPLEKIANISKNNRFIG